MSPATPVPEIVGSAVVVSVEPLAGLVIVGAAGAVDEPSVTSIPVPPSEAARSWPAPSVEALKWSVAVCDALLVMVATPVALL